MSETLIIITVFGYIIIGVMSWAVIDCLDLLESSFWWRLYCIYFLKLRLIGKILCFVPMLLFLILVLILVLYYSPILLVVGIGFGVFSVFQKSRKYIINDEIQCKGYHCDRRDE